MFMLRRFFSGRSGNVAIVFAIAAIPTVVATGMAVDYAKGALRKADLQAALDAAVLSAVSVSAREKKLGTVPTKIAQTTFRSLFKENTTELSFSEQNGVVHGRAAFSIESAFGSAVGVTQIAISAKAAATNNPTRHPVCFMAMHPSRKHTLELKDSVSVVAPDCHIYGNSDHVDDVVDPHTPENFLIGKTVQAVGYGHHYIQNVKPPLEHAPEILSDPLYSFPIPLYGACAATGLVVNSHKTELSPGTYCNGLSIHNANNVKFSPGVYIIKGGTFNVSNSSISGKDVTIIVVQSVLPINWVNSSIEIEAPRNGPLAGLAVLGERKPSVGLIDRSKIDIHGTFYMPNTEFEWINDGKFKPKAKWTSWIVDGISWRGNGVISINFDYQHPAIPFPSALLNVIPTVGPGRARLVR